MPVYSSAKSCRLCDHYVFPPLRQLQTDGNGPEYSGVYGRCKFKICRGTTVQVLHTHARPCKVMHFPLHDHVTEPNWGYSVYGATVDDGPGMIRNTDYLIYPFVYLVRYV